VAKHITIRKPKQQQAIPAAVESRKVVQLDDTSWVFRYRSERSHWTCFVLRINDNVWYFRANYKDGSARVDRVDGGFTCSRCHPDKSVVKRCDHVEMLAGIGISAYPQDCRRDGGCS
jgi:hypothetical protein